MTSISKHLAVLSAWLMMIPTIVPAQATDAAGFNGMVARYVADYFKFTPLEATAQGNHDHDREIGDFSAAGHAARAAMLHRYLDQFAALDPAGLSLTERDDLEFLISSIKSALLAEERVRRWQLDPDLYIDVATGSVFVLIERDFALPEERLRSVIAREKLLPGVLAAGQVILAKPAAAYTRIALQQIDGNIAFFTNDLPAAFASVPDGQLKSAFKQANDAVIASLVAYKQFLHTIEVRSTEPFAIGAELFRQKLLDDEMVDLPLGKILEVGTAQLRQDQAAEADAAHQIDPHASLDQVMQSIKRDTVAASQLVPKAQSQLAALRQFVIDHKLLTIDGTEQPKVSETPPFMRATTQASMDPPGPLETSTKQAFYYITLPDPAWSAAKQAEYLQGYNISMLQNTSVHEVWPGHFVQYLFREHTRDMSLVRQLFSANTTVEGWAHYSEQMMIDEGLGGGDPKFRVAQLQDALLRDCRLIVGIKMHTQGMTVEQAQDLFVKEGHQQPVIAQMEALRGTEDPTYLYYTLGKLGILKLRADYQAKLGSAFTLQDFHDRFNRAGTIPLKLIRREMMGADGPLL